VASEDGWISPLDMTDGFEGSGAFAGGAASVSGSIGAMFNTASMSALIDPMGSV
jgi:hypothetical protein